MKLRDLVLSISIVLMLASCRSTHQGTTNNLPIGASEPVSLGNGWYEFKFRKRCYAYTLETSYSAYQTTAIFEVDCETDLTPPQ